MKAAYLDKRTALADIGHNLKTIKDLDEENPNARVFSRVESDAEKSFDVLKAASKELNRLLFDANPDIENDESYLADLKAQRAQHIELCNAIDDYIEILNIKGIKYPSDAKPVVTSGDLDNILATLVSSQDKQVLAQNKCMDKLVKSHGNSGPKAIQPIFTSKNNDSDYDNY